MKRTGCGVYGRRKTIFCCDNSRSKVFVCNVSSIFGRPEQITSKTMSKRRSPSRGARGGIALQLLAETPCGLSVLVSCHGRSKLCLQCDQFIGSPYETPSKLYRNGVRTLLCITNKAIQIRSTNTFQQLPYHYLIFLDLLTPCLIPVLSPWYSSISPFLISLTAPFLLISAFLYCSLFFTRGFLLIFALWATRPRFLIIV